MLVKDKALKVMVDVCDKACPWRSCYWARPDPGSFTQGQGYRERTSGSRGWLCGRREISGCPNPMPEPSQLSTQCRKVKS